VFSGDGTLYANSVTTNKLWRIAIGKDGKVGAIADITASESLKGADGFRLISGNRFLLEENAAGRVDEVDIAGDKATIKVLKDGLVTPTSAVRVHSTIYVVQRKIDYVRKPELKVGIPDHLPCWLYHYLPNKRIARMTDELLPITDKPRNAVMSAL
jgi:hypothetical protein